MGVIRPVGVLRRFCVRHRHCWVDSENINKGWAPRTFCPADEHYFPTLLASLGRQNETDCTVQISRYPCMPIALSW